MVTERDGRSVDGQSYLECRLLYYIDNTEPLDSPKEISQGVQGLLSVAGSDRSNGGRLSVVSRIYRRALLSIGPGPTGDSDQPPLFERTYRSLCGGEAPHYSGGEAINQRHSSIIYVVQSRPILPI